MRFALALSLLVFVAWAASGPSQPTYEKNVRPFLVQHCLPCHQGKQPPAGIGFESIKTHNQMVSNPELWDRVLRAVQSGAMPPTDSKPNSREFVKSVQAILNSECRLAEPGVVTLRRLNREEYNNSVRDLTGVDVSPADDFPSDDVGEGFDNIGDVLSLSPLLAEKYLSAAERVAEAAIPLPVKRRIVLNGELLEASSEGARLNGELWGMFSNSSVGGIVRPVRKGQYLIEVLCFGQQAGPDPVKMSVSIDGRVVERANVVGTPQNPTVVAVTANLEPGPHKVSAEFLNDYYQPNDPDPKNRDRNMTLLAIVVEGPINAVEPKSKLWEGTLTEENFEAVVRELASRAYRRPASDTEVNQLVKLGKSQHDSPQASLRLVLQALLVSPKFLFRVELDQSEQRTLTPHEVASRLSYFLWSSMPDAELRMLADQGKLKSREHITAQVARMLKDPKAKAFTANFAGQWLQLRKLDTVNPDSTAFPKFTQSLKRAMRQETETYFNYVVRENRPASELLDSDYTFVNRELGQFYGIKSESELAHQMVKLTDRRRGGILGHASILLLTSNPTRTSPVKRGKWILENILGAPTPPPPPDVGVLDEKPNPVTGTTLRQRIESHRKKPECAVCHQRLDPFGLALDGFDAIGRLRTQDEGLPIDQKVKLPDGTQLNGPESVRKFLVRRKQEFASNLTKKLLTYAVGRGIRASDQCYVDAVLKETEPKGYRLQSLITEVVLSEPFMKKGARSSE